MNAFRNNDVETVSGLFEKSDFNVNIKDKDGWTPLMYASAFGCDQVIELLLKKIMYYSEDEQEKIINAQESKHKLTPIMYASMRGHKKIVEQLFLNPYLDINKVDNYGFNALFYASARGHTEIVNYLFEHSCINVNLRDNYGNTPLVYATIFEHKEVAKILEQYGAKSGIVNNYEKTLEEIVNFSKKYFENNILSFK